MHILRHTHTSTHVQSAHKRNGDNQAQQPGWEGRKKVFVRDLAHKTKKCREKTDIHESKGKHSGYFLQSNKSNINQIYMHLYIHKYLCLLLYLFIFVYIYIYVCIYCGSVLFTPNKFPRRNCRELSKLPWLSNRKIKRLTKPVGAVSDISPEVSSTDQPASNTKAFSDSRLSLEWQFKHESDKVPEKAGWNHIDPTSHAIDFCGSVLFPLS